MCAFLILITIFLNPLQESGFQRSLSEIGSNKTYLAIKTYPSLTLTLTHTHVYIYIYIYISSSSRRAISTGIPDPLSPLFSIVHCFRQVLRATFHIGTELLYVGSSWLSCLCLSKWRGPQEYFSYEFVLTSPVRVLHVWFV